MEILRGWRVTSKLPSVLFVVFWLGLTLATRQAFGQGHRDAESAARLHFPLTSFYDVTIPLASGKPGTLIRSEPFDQYEIPFGASAIRILYHSVSASGEDVAASGVVMIPADPAPRGGWPVIVWGHSLLSPARACAPSLMKVPQGGPFLGMYLNLGFAVIAPDYVGLGTAFRNAALDMRSNANDLMFAVPAARQAVPQLSTKWIALGDRDGGAAAVMLDEMESAINDAGYLGSISISGELDLKTILQRAEKSAWNDDIALLLYGAKTLFPAFHPEEVLSAAGLARYRQATEECAAPVLHTVPLLDEMLRPEAAKSPNLQKFVQRNTLGLQRAKAPLLVVSGQDPEANGFPAETVVHRLCATGDQVDFETFPGVDPGHVIGTSVAAQISWIKARFAGRVTPNSCH
ncbi:MAG: lipase family protein [Candidatus Sulfotelmatobacter sp.]